MAKRFHFVRLAPSLPELLNVVTAVLGNPGERFSDADVDKAMKMQSDGCSYQLCADGDDIEGFLDSVNMAPSNSEFKDGAIVKRYAGGVRRSPVNREYAEIVGEPVKLLDYVVASGQHAVGRRGIALAKKGAPKIHHWRVIGFHQGNGEPGSIALIERDN